ncbi:uncharacterized protein LOC129598522 [Paramacrobiotus metropolitanus]|uniref:uncharacterized protein LOC129598522 n=1 Tax=Paramacrobiotus metropolitanus TaxID=2943436 RepID=UPI00244614EB|nr:uncharacterized protein LOC129598522 [Paramacrobiotus metropolitanus]
MLGIGPATLHSHTKIVLLFLQSDLVIPFPVLLSTIAVSCITVGVAAVLYVNKSRSLTVTLRQAFIYGLKLHILQLLGLLFDLKYRIFDTRRAKSIQKNLLKSILRANRSTEYGRQQGFAAIHSRHDFLASQSLTNYEHYKHHIQRMQRNGAKNILLKENNVSYIRTAGISGFPKVIPQGSAIGQFRIKCILARQRCRLVPSKLRYHRNFRLSSENMKYPNVPPPTDSNRIRLILKSDLLVNPTGDYLMPDEDTTRYIETLFALREESLVMIEAVYIWEVLLMFQCIELNWREMLHDIRHGTLNDTKVIVTPATKEKLVKQLSPMPQRADYLEMLFTENLHNRQGFYNITRRIWPKLAAINGISTGPFAHYADILTKKFCPDIPVFTPHAFSTETGIFGRNLCDKSVTTSTQFLLDIHSAFFEFLPLGNPEETDTVFVEQVEIGQLYELIVTTRNGLYRYRTGDVIEVVGKHHQCPIFEFSHRRCQTLSIFHENIPETVLREAISNVNSEALHWNRKHTSESLPINGFIEIADYCASLSQGLTGYFPSDLNHVQFFRNPQFYIVFVELHGLIQEDIHALEERLSQLFENHFKAYHDACSGELAYLRLRNDVQIGVPRICIVKPGTFKKLRTSLRRNDDQGLHPSRLQIPRVLKYPEHAELLFRNRIIRHTNV